VLALALPLLPSTTTAASTTVADATKHSKIMVATTKALEDLHFSRQPLNDNMSKKILFAYLRRLDPNRLYFTQDDVSSLEKKYTLVLDNAMRAGDKRPALNIFSLYRERLSSRMSKNLESLQKDFQFEGAEEVPISREDAPWEGESVLNKMWSQRVEAELLQETLSDRQDGRAAKDVLGARYRQIRKAVEDMSEGQILDDFLNTVMKAYDPHSEYMSADAMENFDISMRLSLVGIGAVLMQDDDYVKIAEVVPGGPAAQDGRLQPNDIIVEVAEENEAPKDIVGMRVDDVVKLIRGEKGTTVKLTVLPAGAPAVKETVDLTRDLVKLTDAEARAELIELGTNGAKRQVGWITLPSFYASMGSAGPEKSVTKDVALLLKRLKGEGMDGLIIDLRRDGGGSLEEAINLTGLFIPKGPVVQAKDARGKVAVSSDRNPKVSYDGPLIVLVNRMSASASEIFAAAMQDYNRAIIVGDSKTFGKGTVQTVLDLSRVMPYLGMTVKNPGSLKLTVQKFYRINGGSIQLTGVASDIVLPSVTDTEEVSEEKNHNRMGYDVIPPSKFELWGSDFDLEVLKSRSAERIADDVEFSHVRENIELLKSRLEDNSLSLDKAVRETEIAEAEERERKRAEILGEIQQKFNPAVKTMTVVNAVQGDDLEQTDYLSILESGGAKGRARQKDKPLDGDLDPVDRDPVKRETLFIMVDLLGLSELETKTAKSD